MAGIGTGSIYCSRQKAIKEFPFECKRTRVIVVKLHSVYDKKLDYDKAILIIRNPFSSIFSRFNFFVSNGVYGYANEQQFKGELLVLSNWLRDV